MSGFTLVSVTGRYLNPATGAPRTGTVTFTLPNPLSNGGQSTAATFTATLDSGGNLSILLPATNDPGTTPAGMVYHVAESLDGGTAGSAYSLPVTTGNANTGIVLGAVPALGEPLAKVSVTGSKSSGAALTSLLTGLASLGLITDNTTA